MAEWKMTPVLKWAGGKSQLLDQIKSRIPSSFHRYHEPFIGGAAVLLGISPERAFINDINAQLINLYMQLKSSAESVLQYIRELDSVPCDKERYYATRERYNAKILKKEFDVECAALMIWMNKHCFNGLYRVNRKGLFNVPYNNKIFGKSVIEENIRYISEYLNRYNVGITCGDFEIACEKVRPNDFVYLDSPYVPVSETAYFTDYAVDGFSMDDHVRLSKVFKQLDYIGAKLMLSNNDVPLVWSLYEGYHIESLDVKRRINRDADKRTGREVLITNY